MPIENNQESFDFLLDDFQQAVRGFQTSRVLLTAIELDVFTSVGKGAYEVDTRSRNGEYAWQRSCSHRLQSWRNALEKSVS